MPIIASYQKTEFSHAPEGLHPAVAVDVVDLGIKSTAYGDKHKVRVVWMLEDEDEHGKPYMVSQMFTLSLHPKSVLSKTLEAWRGKPFTDAERAGFDLEKLIGAPCQVQVVHAPGKDGTTYANVQAVVPLGRGMTAPRANGYVRQKDRQHQPEIVTEGPAPADAEDAVPF